MSFVWLHLIWRVFYLENHHGTWNISHNVTEQSGTGVSSTCMSTIKWIVFLASSYFLEVSTRRSKELRAWWSVVRYITDWGNACSSDFCKFWLIECHIHLPGNSHPGSESNCHYKKEACKEDTECVHMLSAGGRPHPFPRFGRYGILSVAEREFCIQTCGRCHTRTLTSTATGHLCGSVSRNSVKIPNVRHMKELSFPSGGTVYATLFPFLLHYYSHLCSLLLLLVENETYIFGFPFTKVWGITTLVFFEYVTSALVSFTNPFLILEIKDWKNMQHLKLSVQIMKQRLCRMTGERRQAPVQNSKTHRYSWLRLQMLLFAGGWRDGFGDRGDKEGDVEDDWLCPIMEVISLGCCS